MGVFPESISKAVREALDQGIFESGKELFSLVMETGMYSLFWLLTNLKQGVSITDPTKTKWWPLTARYVPSQGYVRDNQEAKKKLEKVSAEEIKKKLLKMLDTP